MLSRCLFGRIVQRFDPIARPSLRSVLVLRQNGVPPRMITRALSSKTTVDEKIEEIQELYATAKDEFEIAAEETEKMTVYAEDDRKAAREELDKLKAVFQAAVEGKDKQAGEEVKQRAGQRIRELDHAVQAMEELARNQD